jgi:copper transport protein
MLATARPLRVPARPAPARLLLVVVALFLLLGAVFASPAGAHAALLQMTPEADSTVQEPPSEVLLEFNESVSATSTAVRVFDPSGKELRGIEVSGTDATVTATLPEFDTDGSYTVDWKVVSADGHPIRGAYLFHLRTATLTEPFDAGSAGSPLVANIMRAAGATLALAALVGVLVAALRRRAGQTPTSGWFRWRWVLVFDGTLLLFIGALAVVGSSFSEAIEVTLDTSSGKVALLACVLALVGVVVSLVPKAAPAELPLGVLTVAAIAMQGHAVSLPPVALSAPLTVLHVAAAVTWGVGLVWIDQRCRTARPEQLRREVERLSPFAMGAVVVLAITGVVLIVDRVPLDLLLSSNYGRLGVLKTVLLLATVVVAFRNRARVTPELSPDTDAPDSDAPDPEGGDGDGIVVERLRRGVRAEIVLLSIALIAGAVLSQISPPDPEAASGGLFTERAAFGEGEVELTVEPGARGTNEVHVVALGDDGRLMADLTELSMSLTLTSEDVGPLQPEMQVVTPGHSLSYADFPLVGDWTVEVTARLGKFEALKATFEVPIGPR